MDQRGEDAGDSTADAEEPVWSVPSEGNRRGEPHREGEPVVSQSEAVSETPERTLRMDSALNTRY